jgi:uncharacterized protein (UPF0264 family)
MRTDERAASLAGIEVGRQALAAIIRGFAAAESIVSVWSPTRSATADEVQRLTESFRNGAESMKLLETVLSECERLVILAPTDSPLDDEYSQAAEEDLVAGASNPMEVLRRMCASAETDLAGMQTALRDASTLFASLEHEPRKLPRELSREKRDGFTALAVLADTLRAKFETLRRAL